MKALNGMPEGRTIPLFENIGPDLDNIVRPDSNKKLIECRMMKVAQGQAVSNNGRSSRIRIGNDMRCIQ